MATIQVVDNFSTQAWDSSAGTPLRGTSPLHGNEPNSLEISTAATNEYVQYAVVGGAPTRPLFAFWFRFNAFPVADSQIAKIDFGSFEGRLIMQPSGVPYIKSDGTPTMGSNIYGGGALLINTWYWAEMMLDVSADPWQLQTKIASSTMSTTAAQAATTAGNSRIQLGTNRSDSLTCYYSYLHYGTATDDTDFFGEQSQSAAGTNVRGMLMGIG